MMGIFTPTTVERGPGHIMFFFFFFFFGVARSLVIL